MTKVLILLSFLPTLAFSQAWQFQAGSARPLLDVIRELRGQHGWLITYEEGPYLSNSIRMNREKLLAPSMSPVLYKLDSLSATRANQYSLQEKASRMRKLVTEQNASMSIGAFREIPDGRYIYVEPYLWSNDGIARGYTSLLQTAVTLKPITEYATLAAVLNDIISQVRVARNVSISVGMIPGNVFLLQQPLFDIKPGVSARDALINLFSQANRKFPTPITENFCWELVYDPNSKGYFFNVVTVHLTERSSKSPDQREPVGAPINASTDSGSKLVKTQ
jgi:hypothetical protein